MKHLRIIAAAALGIVLALSSHADDEIGIFETILESSQSFAETTAGLEAAIDASSLTLHATHDVRVPDDKHQARVYVLTSPDYAAAAAAESPRTISAQILRLAVYTTGDEQTTFINMANPVAHAMVYYAGSVNYDMLVAAAQNVAGQLRQVAAAVPGTAMSKQDKPRRTEKRYKNFNGDGPARMMAKFREWKKSQRPILKDTAANFDTVAETVAARLESREVIDAEDTKGWEVLSRIELRDDVVHIGLTNPYIEDKMVRINSRFRNDGKSDLSPYPGVDHVAALPTEVLIVKEGSETKVLHYGQMWRMQLYFWDSGYRAFTANVGVPGNIMSSIEDTIKSDR